MAYHRAMFSIDPVKIGQAVGEAARRDRRLMRLLNTYAVLILGWLGYALYLLVTDSGLARVLRHFLMSPSGWYSGLGVFALSAMTGFAPLTLLTWLIWRVFLRRRTPGAAEG